MRTRSRQSSPPTYGTRARSSSKVATRSSSGVSSTWNSDASHGPTSDTVSACARFDELQKEVAVFEYARVVSE